MEIKYCQQFVQMLEKAQDNSEHILCLLPSFNIELPKLLILQSMMFGLSQKTEIYTLFSLKKILFLECALFLLLE